MHMGNLGRFARDRAWGRLVVAVAAAILVLGGAVAAADEPAPPAAATPQADCGPGSLPETDIQGRVPKADYRSGRVRQGYLCNTEQVSHQGSSGGFKTLRYTDEQGNTCAFYDSTLMIGFDVLNGLATGNGLGVVVLDMNDPARPQRTANLTSPAMLSPHESLLLNAERGLLTAVMGTAATAPGVLDVYDIATDCRRPRLLSTTTSAMFGHESGLSPDGMTFWSAGAVGANLTAVDLSDPRKPRRIFSERGVIYHGLRFSADGDTMYVADMGTPTGNSILDDPGLAIYDVSEVHAREADAEIHLLSEVSWPEASIPQVAQPFSQDGHEYVLEVDEFTDLFGDGLTVDLRHGPVGAARIINVDDPTAPYVVSDIRLQVHQPEFRDAELFNDPGAALPIQGYSAHYCSVPSRDDPQLAACSMTASGLRVFDISDVEQPREIAYFNKPITFGQKLLAPQSIGAWAMSQPAWDAEGGAVWYTDANSGFYAVRLINGAAQLLR